MNKLRMIMTKAVASILFLTLLALNLQLTIVDNNKSDIQSETEVSIVSFTAQVQAQDIPPGEEDPCTIDCGDNAELSCKDEVGDDCETLNNGTMLRCGDTLYTCP